MRAVARAVPTEHVEQVRVVQWFHYAHRQLAGCLFAIPNGGDRHPVVAAKLRAEGVRKGVLDLFLMVPRGDWCGLFVEMKRRNAPPSAVSDEQREFLALAERMGYRAVVCRGADEAVEAINGYLANGDGNGADAA